MMKNRISDGADVPYFFRDFIAMITEVTEDEWDTPKDQSSKLTKENTLRTYAKRGISKKFAVKSISVCKLPSGISRIRRLASTRVPWQ